MFRTTIALQQTRSSRISRGRTPVVTLTRWRRFVLVSYALLFACVLPCICWGAVGTPGHPHAAPHFVFTEPPGGAATATPALHGHRSNVSPCHSHAPQWGTDGNATSDAAGRSVPDTVTVVSLIMLTLLLGWSFPMPSLYQIKRALAILLAKSAVLAVPTPPPRSSALAGYSLAV